MISPVYTGVESCSDTYHIMTNFFYYYFAAVPLDKLLKDPAQFQEFLYKTTKLSPRVVALLFNSTVNVQKVGT